MDKSISSREIGSKSIEIIRESASVANIRSQSHGPRTAVPAIEGEERKMANPERPSHTIACVASNKRPPLKPSPAGISNVSNPTRTRPPSQMTWSDTDVWFLRSAIAVNSDVKAA